jgi:hypothetical protein
LVHAIYTYVRGRMVSMELRIVVESLDPPTGSALVDGRDELRFVGWLELMEALERFSQDHITGAPAPGSQE